MSTVTTHPYIVSTPGTCGGRPRIDGHRIRVRDIVGLYFGRGHSIEEIHESYPNITLAQIHSALAYYHDHRDEMDQQIRADDEFAENFMKQSPQGVIDWKQV